MQFSLPALMAREKWLFQRSIEIISMQNDAYGHFSNVAHRTAWCIDPHGDYDNDTH